MHEDAEQRHQERSEESGPRALVSCDEAMKHCLGWPETSYAAYAMLYLACRDLVDIDLTRADPPSPRPPRVLACTSSQGTGDRTTP